jgi:hypothetical protein
VNTDQFLISFCRYAPKPLRRVSHLEIHLLLKQAARRASRARCGVAGSLVAALHTAKLPTRKLVASALVAGSSPYKRLAIKSFIQR